jgi:hypothetical protein
VSNVDLLARSTRSGSTSEDAVPPRADDAGGDDQQDAEQDLALEQLDDANDCENDSDNPKN